MAALFDFATAPVLETARLRLRVPAPEHEEPYITMLLDDEVGRFVFGPFDRTSAWRSLATAIGHWALRGYGQFIVEDRVTGRFLGRVGLVGPPGWPGLELAWTLARGAWGQGYAAEAAVAVRAHVVRTRRPERLISLIDPRNTRSVALAARLGARRAERIAFDAKQVDVWEHPLDG